MLRSLGSLTSLLLAFALIFCFTGCEKKLGKEQLEALHSLAASSKERATNFAAVAPTLKAKDATHADAMARYVAAHTESLARKAKALSDLYEAAQSKALSKASLNQIAEDIKTSHAESAGWAQASQYLTLTDEFAAAHAAGLARDAKQTEALLEFLNRAKGSD